jgi:restriction system protein
MARSLRLISVFTRVIVFPLRYSVARALLAIVLSVGGIAAGAAFTAGRWTDGDGAVFIAVFLAIYTALIIAAIALWLAFLHGQNKPARTLAELLSLTPAEFEIAVARMLPSLGYRQVSVVGGPGDLAADIICNDRQGGLVVVQCKRKLPGQRVGSSEMQKFIGMISVHHEADAGIFVTTSEFTQPAIALAEQHEILLLDGALLSELVHGRKSAPVRAIAKRRDAA